jgi:hypothetical protein
MSENHRARAVRGKGGGDKFYPVDVLPPLKVLYNIWSKESGDDGANMSTWPLSKQKKKYPFLRALKFNTGV